MFLFPAAVTVGAAVGLATGGRLKNLSTLRLRQPWVVAVALALQFAPGLAAIHSRPAVRLALVGASYALMAAWLVVNLRGRPAALRGALGLVLLGWTLNMVVMVPNRGMPVSQAALARIGAPGHQVTEGHLWKHVSGTAGRPLSALSDVIPVPVPGLRNVVSIGDLVLLAGVALVVGAAMRSEPGSAGWV